MDKNICTVLAENDLSAENIKSTVNMIEHNPNKFYLLQSGWQTNLWEVLEKISRVRQDENTLTKMRIAYNLQFDLPTMLKAGNSDGVAVKNFADLLERLDFDENFNLNRTDYHVIINDTNTDAANQAVKKIFQQIAFLSIDGLNVCKQSEIRPIRIAVMGLKKAGKSLLINNFIKGDYTPTDSTLLKPNTIKYIPADPKKRLTLDYGDRRFVFGGAEDLKYFIGKEYARAQKNTGEDSSLPDMTIHYPCEGGGYEIWEIPAPNVVFTNETIQKTKKIIETVDVCIFVMNYSIPFRTDEVTFLKNIREVVNDKPFIVAVNRIDERYVVNEEKSVARILDYISCRFESLGYKNLFVFGTSALQNFYLDKVVELADRAGLPVDLDSIRPLRRKYREHSTPIKFIGDALGNLEDFHGTENASEKEIRAFSGVEQLIRCVDYLGEQVRHKN